MKTSRRGFLQTSALASGACLLPGFAIGKPGPSANGKLNVAFIGVGRQGIVNLVGFQTLVNVVALCDVNEKAYERVPAELAKVPRFTDLRVMLDKMDREIDAVVVSTPDHSHFWIGYSVMERGKHLFLEKPLAHTPWQARRLKQAAKEFKVITASGNLGRAWEGIRRLKEWVDAGVLGEVREVHGVLERNPRSKNGPGWTMPNAEPVPDTIDWDLWLGSAAHIDYRRLFTYQWRPWWRFATGLIGDWGVHILDGAHYALDMSAPIAAECTVDPDYSNGEMVPWRTHSVLHYPARDGKPPLKVNWWMGTWEETQDMALPSNRAGMILVGDKHTLQAGSRSDAKRITTMSDDEWLDFRKNMPPRVIPRVGNHLLEWVNAIVNDGPTPGTAFAESAPFIEALLLTSVLEKAGGGRIEWDPENMRITNNEALNDYINPPAREAFDVGRS